MQEKIVVLSVTDPGWDPQWKGSQPIIWQFLADTT